MKKILATVLLASVSMGVMASPAKCMLDWAKAHGANVKKESSYLNKDVWGYGNTFKWNKQGPTDGYRLVYLPTPKNLEMLKHSGPWQCHCTYNTANLPDDHNYYGINGVCGVW